MRACPVCGEANGCSGGDPSNCWCVGAAVTPEVLLRVGAPGPADPCLCRRCLAGEVPSPCTRRCRLDPGRTACTGCGRTLAEIKAWFRADPGERAGIRLALARRLETGLVGASSGRAGGSPRPDPVGESAGEPDPAEALSGLPAL